MTALSQYTDFLQVANGALTIVLIAMMIIFSHYTWRKWLVWRRLSTSFYADVKPAVAIFVFVLGEGIVRAVIWFAQYERIPWAGEGYNVNFMLLVLIFGVLTAGVGGLCVVRAFSPLKYRWLTWSATLVAAVIFSAVTWPR